MVSNIAIGIATAQQLPHETKISPYTGRSQPNPGLFPWLLGAGMGGREWHAAPWGHRQPPFTPMIGRIHTSLN